MPFLEINNLQQSYGDKEILKNVNLGISEGEFIALVGMSGGASCASSPAWKSRQLEKSP